MSGTSMQKWACLWFFASACAAEISEKDRADARIQYDVGVDALGKGNVPGALQAFQASERLDPSFPDLHSGLGLVYISIGRYPDAERHFNRALELKPQYSDVRNNLGLLYSIQGKYDQAIEQFQLALQDVLYATPSHAEGNMGYAYYKKGDRMKAIKHLKNATLVNPKFCRGYLWLGEIYQASNELKDAERYLDRFVERCLLDPNLKSLVDAAAQSEAYLRLAEVTLAAGNAPRARSAYQACVAAGRDTPHYDACDEGLKKLPAE
jgi:type IV pilus biogenesis/stability protein PilW